MSKRFKGKTCVYCNQRKSIRQGDHVFAREFFLEDERSNLIKVPACDLCNNEKSKIEHYLTAVLPFGGRHVDAELNLSTKVPSRLNKNINFTNTWQLIEDIYKETQQMENQVEPWFCLSMGKYTQSYLNIF